MSDRVRLLIATRNQGKLREYRQLLANMPVEITDLDELGITEEVAETGSTFVENAVQKALTYARLSGLWTWADDSGLEVDALGGEPGVHSARFAGLEATDADRYGLLLQRMAHVPPGQRTARFYCVIAIATPEGHVEVAEGRCEGEIALAPRGVHGFGYDPVFYLPDHGCTMAELPLEEKNRISHRARATQAAQRILERMLADLEKADNCL
ncbi:MAG: XTP/dITP diphosphatase [Anaerolineae bacterium]|nr:XTP/dITP diphosphatase [Anaerolineae bacterium]MDW8098585.1 XTP/dITP diphosphatase [Anaerolineae bacterium]